MRVLERFVCSEFEHLESDGNEGSGLTVARGSVAMKAAIATLICFLVKGRSPTLPDLESAMVID